MKLCNYNYNTMGLQISSFIIFNIEHRTSRTETNKELLSITDPQFALHFVRIRGSINFKFDLDLTFININNILYLDYELNSDGKLMVIKWMPQEVE